MTTQITERVLLIEAKQQDIEVPTVLIPSLNLKAYQQTPERVEETPEPSITNKFFGRLAEVLATVYRSLSSRPSTERGSIENAMVKARHDRYISFLR